jgi:hypothetical protein
MSRYSDGLEAGRSGFDYRQRHEILPVQTGTGANRASYAMGTGGASPVDKADHSYPRMVPHTSSRCGV